MCFISMHSYWVLFQNINSFAYQKTLLHALLLLVFKIVESLQWFLKSTREAFLVSFVSFYQEIFLAIFYMFLLHLSIQILTLEIHSFKQLQYIFECNNSYKLCENQLSLNLKLTRVWHFITKKKRPHEHF